MPRSRALCISLALWLGGCDSQIVLGDSESSLPLAGGPNLGGTTSGGSAGTAADNAGGLPGSGGTTSGSAGSAQGGAIGNETPIAPPGDELWSTDFEVGDFSDWDDGGELQGGNYDWGSANGYVDLGVGRDGSNGVVANIHSVARGETSGGVRMYRRTEDGPAYYSAWFRLEEAHTVADWWSIFLFHASDTAALDLESDVSLWDVRVVDAPSGEMALQFFDHDVMQGTLAGPAGIVKSRRWFEIKAYLDYRPPDDTRVVVWLNGTLLFDMKRLHTDKLPSVFWSIGNGASQLDPEESTLYVDDAAIHQLAKP